MAHLKTLIVMILTLNTVSFAAHAKNLARIQISVKAPKMTVEQQHDNLCYQLANQGEDVAYKLEKMPWYKSLDSEPATWRITRLGAGMDCEVLVKGNYNMQVGPGAEKEGCRCKGYIEALR